MSSSRRRRIWSKITGRDEKNSPNRLSPAPAPGQLSVPATSPRSSFPSSLGQDLGRLEIHCNSKDDATTPEPEVTDPAPKADEVPERALTNLWAKAAEVLRADPDPEKRSLIEQYSAIMKNEVGDATDDRDGPFMGLQSGQAAKLLNAKAEELKNRKMTVGSGKYEFNIEAHFNNVAKHIIMAKDLISSAAGAEPHASVACAGVVVILSFLIRQVEQREQLFKGLELVSSIICRYLVMETVYRPRARVTSASEDAANELERDFENNLVNLYAKALEFQARALGYVQRSRASQAFRDTFRGDTWKILMTDIKDLDGQCRAFADLITDEKLHSFLDNQREPLAQSRVRARLDVVESDELQKLRVKCLQLLDTCPYRSRKDINPERVEGTCEWFVEHDLFHAWADSTRSSILWVSADPGCGKSVLSKFLVDNVLPRKMKDSVLCYFFFKEDFADQRTVPVALCSILRQLFLNRPSLLTSKRMIQFMNEGKQLTESISSLFEMLIALAAESNSQICCLIDALDECVESDRRELISALSKFYMSPDENHCLKLIVTSRPEMIIQRQFRRLENNWPEIHLRGEDNEQLARISQEINIFARDRIQCIAESLVLDPVEAEFLEKEISKPQNRTYLWVKVALDVIENLLAFTTDTAAEILAGLPEGLDMLYEKILSRSHNIEKARKVLHIVIAASRPLSIGEMAVALALSTNNRFGSDTQLEPAERFRETIRATCGLFITIVDDEIYFIHQTAKEFLIRDHGDQQGLQPVAAKEQARGSLTWKHSLSLSDSHLVLARVCMAYLGSILECPVPESLQLGKVVPDTDKVLFDYSALFWHRHLSQSTLSDAHDIETLSMELCQATCTAPVSSNWFRVWLLAGGYLSNFTGDYGMKDIDTNRNVVVPECPTVTIVASACGLKEVVADVCTANGQALLDTDNLGRTPLWWASREGQSDVVRLILNMSPSNDLQTTPWTSSINDVQDGFTPLMVASAFGHVSTVQTLLEDPRVDPGTKLSSRTALYYAICGGHMPVTEVLISYRQTLANLSDAETYDHFREAVNQGYSDAVVKLAKCLPTGFRDESGASPFLTIIAEFKWKSQQLSSDLGETKLDTLKAVHDLGTCDASDTDNSGRSAVWWAADTPGSPDVLEWLISDVKLNPDAPEVVSGQTPFARAAARCSVEKLIILHQTGKFNINSVDSQNRTPLMHVVLSSDPLGEDSDSMVETTSWLLSQGAILDAQDRDRRTALMHAAELGLDRIVELFISNGALLDVRDGEGKTALMLARARHDLPLREDLYFEEDDDFIGNSSLEEDGDSRETSILAEDGDSRGSSNLGKDDDFSGISNIGKDDDSSGTSNLGKDDAFSGISNVGYSIRSLLKLQSLSKIVDMLLESGAEDLSEIVSSDTSTAETQSESEVDDDSSSEIVSEPVPRE